MSDPMSNVEIEDVLSSIRRLVSENATRPRSGAHPEPEEGAADALVLTPSLRVGEAGGDAAAEHEAQAEGAAMEEPVTEVAAQAGDDALAESAIDDVAANAAAPPPQEDGAQEAAGGETAPQFSAETENALDASWEKVASPEDPLWRAPQTLGIGPEPAEDDLPANDPADAPADDRLMSRVEGLEAAFDEGEGFEPDGSEVAVSEATHDWEDDAPGEDTVIDLSTPDVPAGRLHFSRAAPEQVNTPPEPSADGPEAEAWPAPEADWTAPDLPRPQEQEPETATDAWPKAATPEAAPDDAHGAMPEDPAEATAEDAPAVLFRSSHRTAPAVPEAPATEEPVEPDAQAPEPEEQADPGHDEPEVLFEAEHDDDEPGLDGYVIGTEESTAHLDVPDEPDPWEDHDEAALAAAVHAPEAAALIDESRLADLVAQAVRAELRGQMGERITRNVRKLVRREIARALETRGIR